ncbi:MAG: ceramide glucosyltransferase [Maritimibacter sp.]
MITGALILALLALIGLHLITSALAAWRYLRPIPTMPEADLPFVTLVRPVCGVDRFDPETLGSSFDQDYPDYEILFCAAREDDPAVALVQSLIDAHPEAKAQLLIGEDYISANPKLNNMAKGYHAAQSDLVCITDSNLMLPPDYLRQLMPSWTPGTGAVSAPAAGNRAKNIWGAVECAFLNTNQARWQLAADSVGLGFAQGKTLFYSRPVVEAAGGLSVLGREMAEDLATTKLVRGQGLKVSLAQRLFSHPVGSRSFEQTWNRQLRWSKIRRDGFPLLFLPEILQVFAVPLILLIALLAMGAAPLWTLPALFVIWYGSEYLLARIAGWPTDWRSLVAMPIRDALLPAIWLATWGGRDISWRGTHIAASETGHI